MGQNLKATRKLLVRLFTQGSEPVNLIYQDARSQVGTGIPSITPFFLTT